MLHTLHLQNFALIDVHEVSFDAGFNVITGETGAGKSLLLDALDLCTGGRSDSSMIRHGEKTAELVATFSSTHEDVAAWFTAQARDFSDGEIIIRRQLSDQGRSKAWINGVPASLGELKALGAMLVNIHSQHAGLELLKPQFVIDWLDGVGELIPLSLSTRDAYHAWQDASAQVKQAHADLNARLDRIDLLTAKLADIEPLLAVDMHAIEAEHETLSNVESLIACAYQAANLLNSDSDEPDSLSLLVRAARLCEQHSHISGAFAHANDALANAQALIEDAASSLADYADTLSANPERLAELDGILSLAHRLSGKYRLPIDSLIADARHWQDELDALSTAPELEQLQQAEAAAFDAYVAAAEALHRARVAVAPKLCARLLDELSPLALPNARCEFCFEARPKTRYSATGLYDIALEFSANVGMPMQPLHKVASGGELSRIALVMQVLRAGTQRARPMLIFDEVDVGISGGTAQVVGALLRSLGEHQQLLAITHQAQVAAAAHRHILVGKEHHDQTTTWLRTLDNTARVQELARMSGGVDINNTTLAHAQDLLTASQNQTPAAKPNNKKKAKKP